MKNILIGLLLVGAVAVTAIYFFRKKDTTVSSAQPRFSGTWIIDSLHSNDLVTAILFQKDSSSYELKEAGDSLFISNTIRVKERDTFEIVPLEKLDTTFKNAVAILYSDSLTVKLLTSDSTFIQYKKVK